MKKVIVHIGSGKTGTSSIQNFLSNNKEKLSADWSLDFLDCGLSNMNYFDERLIGHFALVDWLVSENKEMLDKFQNAIKNSSCNCIVLSCENFYHHLDESKIRVFADLLDEFSVEIVCYVRRQDNAAESAWKQQVRVGMEDREFQEFIEKHKCNNRVKKTHLNYFQMLEPWSKHFHTDRIKLRLFEKSKFFGNDLLQDFLTTIDMAAAYSQDLKIMKEHNRSLPTELIELIRKINKKKLVQKKFHHALVRIIESAGEFKNPNLLNIQERIIICEAYSEINKLLIEKYRPINGDNGFDISDLEARVNT